MFVCSFASNERMYKIIAKNGNFQAEKAETAPKRSGRREGQEWEAGGQQGRQAAGSGQGRQGQQPFANFES